MAKLLRIFINSIFRILLDFLFYNWTIKYDDDLVEINKLPKHFKFSLVRSSL
jgi:hypothetical protein